MLFEGFHLYKMVVHVFDSGSSHVKLYTLSAYGFPIVIVALTAVIGHFMGDRPYGNHVV